jgi:hypothetical protein
MLREILIEAAANVLQSGGERVDDRARLMLLPGDATGRKHAANSCVTRIFGLNG